MSKTPHELCKPRYLAEVPHQGQVSVQVSSRETARRTKRENTVRANTSRDIDKEYLVRALSHDIGAHLMLLEFSFRQYEEQAKRLTTGSQALPIRDTMPRLRLASSGKCVTRRDTAHQERVLEIPKRLHLATPSSDSANLNEAASHVTACIDEMKRFVNELISFAKTGNIDMEPSTVSIAELVDEVLFEQRCLIGKRNINVLVSPPLPVVFANPMRIKQVLTNLIRNAAIHGCDTSEPMILIASELVTNTEPGNNAMTGFSVRDNGRGITLAECNRIFEPGYRVPGNQNEGSGIGLAIVKKIAHYYGGDVICQSNNGTTTFVVTLPKG